MLREICDVFKEAYRRGWITTRDGNASYRRPEQSWFYVTPTGVRKNELVPDMCIKLDITENGTSRDKWIAQNDGLIKQQLNRGLNATGELPMHWLFQRHLAGEKHSRVVLHLHPTHVIAATRHILDKVENGAAEPELVEDGLKKLAQDYPEIFRYTRVGKIIGYVEPISVELANAVAGAMLEGEKLVADVVGMDRHGAVAVGTDPWEAFEHIERLNHICEIFLLSRTSI